MTIWNAAAGLRAGDIWCGLRLSRVERHVPIWCNSNFLKPPVSAAREFDGARRAKRGSRLGARPWRDSDLRPLSRLRAHHTRPVQAAAPDKGAAPDTSLGGLRRQG